MSQRLRFLAAVTALSTVGAAQQLSVEITPNPAPVGTPIVVKAQAITPGLFTPNGCLIQGIHSGSPAGPNVALFGCTLLPVAIPPCGGTTFRQGTWNQTLLGGGTAAPGQYWIEIRHSPVMFGPTTPEYFCVTIHDPVVSPVPTLVALNAPVWGSSFDMSLTDVLNPNSVYAVALSATTNTGIPYPGGHAALDPDFLFTLSLQPAPGLFVNFSGVLDAVGASPVVSILLPPVTGITCLQIHAQAVVFGSGGLAVSNAVPITIH